MTAQSDDSSTAFIELPAKLDSSACQDFEAKLRAASGKPVTINAGESKFLGGIGAELLLAASAECRASDQAFTVQTPSNEFTAGLELLGLSIGDLTHEAEA